MLWTIILLVSGGLGWLGGFLMNHHQTINRLKRAQKQSDEYLKQANQKIHDDEIAVMRQRRKDADQYQRTTNEEIDAQEHENMTRKLRLDQRTNFLDQFATRLEMDQKHIDEIQTVLDQRQKKIQNQQQTAHDLIQTRQTVLLLGASDLDASTAKNIVLDKTADSLKWEKDVELKYQDGIAQLNASRDAMSIIITALQNGPDDVPRLHIERTVNVPDFELRNWIAGKEDYHLRIIETLTGTDLIFDPEQPLLLHIVTHDPIRREVVRRALNSLIVSRQITTANIKDQIQNAEIEVNNELYETGEQAVQMLHLKPLHPDFMRIIGRLKFRTSYGQNVLYHSIEVGQLAGSMAAELGLDSQLARRAGLLHDVGKAIDHEVEGTHVELGVQLAESFHEDSLVVNSIAAHHGDVEPQSLVAILVATADALSGARPGARSESVEDYVNRLKSLEKIANEQPGVNESYAIQAGREIRIIVNPKKVDDQQIDQIADHVRSQIESQLSYPGKIKVTTIRKLNAIQYVGYNPNHRKRYYNAS